MCLSMDFQPEKPVIPDYWVTLYSVFNMVKEESNEEIMEQLTDSNNMPDVIQTAYRAVVHQQYDSTCGWCGNYLEEDEIYYEQCRECGYSIEEDGEEEDIRAEEGESAKVTHRVTGWTCPYDGDFTGVGEACTNHDISVNQEGPNYGYIVNDGYHMSRINCYLISDNNFISSPDSEQYIEYNTDELLASFDLGDIISDMVEIYGDDDEALGALGIASRELGNGVVFEFNGETYYYDGDSGELRLHDERFDEMRGHITSSGIEVEVDDDIPFEDALDDVIDKVEEMIEFTEMDSVEGSDALKDAKKLLLELQSMR